MKNSGMYITYERKTILCDLILPLSKCFEFLKKKKKNMLDETLNLLIEEGYTTGYFFWKRKHKRTKEQAQEIIDLVMRMWTPYTEHQKQVFDYVSLYRLLDKLSDLIEELENLSHTESHMIYLDESRIKTITRAFDYEKDLKDKNYVYC